MSTSIHQRHPAGAAASRGGKYAPMGRTAQTGSLEVLPVNDVPAVTVASQSSTPDPAVRRAARSNPRWAKRDGVIRRAGLLTTRELAKEIVARDPEAKYLNMYERNRSDDNPYAPVAGEILDADRKVIQGSTAEWAAASKPAGGCSVCSDPSGEVERRCTNCAGPDIDGALATLKCGTLYLNKHVKVIRPNGLTNVRTYRLDLHAAAAAAGSPLAEQ